MSKPEILQLGSYPDWARRPPDATFTMQEIFDAIEKVAFDAVMMKPRAASATCKTRSAVGKLVHNNFNAHCAGRPLPTKVN